MLRAHGAGVSVGWFCVGVESASIELSMTELTILASLKVDFKRVVYVVLVTEDLFVHVDTSVVNA